MHIFSSFLENISRMIGAHFTFWTPNRKLLLFSTPRAGDCAMEIDFSIVDRWRRKRTAKNYFLKLFPCCELKCLNYFVFYLALELCNTWIGTADIANSQNKAIDIVLVDYFQ